MYICVNIGTYGYEIDVEIGMDRDGLLGARRDPSFRPKILHRYISFTYAYRYIYLHI